MAEEEIKQEDKKSEKEEKKMEKIVETKVDDKKMETKEEKKEEAKTVGKDEEKADVKDDKKVDDKKKEEVKADVKDEKKEKKKDKKKEPELPKKEEAIARGSNLPVSLKHSVFICSFIKGKEIDVAIKELEEVLKMKRAIPFKGEIPHRKGKGMMSGRYPIKASGEFIRVLKGLKGNVIVARMDLDKTRIAEASASWARRPARRGNKKAKRTNLILKAKEIGGKK